MSPHWHAPEKLVVAPVGHAVHVSVAPEPDEKEPQLHTQVAWPARPLVVEPAGQAVQAVAAPADARNVLAAQGVQVMAAPVSPLEKKPAAQLVHASVAPLPVAWKP
jgi:hypothetical protein